MPCRIDDIHEVLVRGIVEGSGAWQAHLAEDTSKGVQFCHLPLKGVGGLKAASIAALELAQSQSAPVSPAAMLC